MEARLWPNGCLATLGPTTRSSPRKFGAFAVSLAPTTARLAPAIVVLLAQIVARLTKTVVVASDIRQEATRSPLDRLGLDTRPARKRLSTLRPLTSVASCITHFGALALPAFQQGEVK